MASERQLARGGENPHAVMGTGGFGFQQKGGFAELGPAREGLHLFGGQFVGVRHHRQGIALVRLFGEHVHLVELQGNGHR